MTGRIENSEPGIELPDLRVARFRFTLRVEEPLQLPPYKGSALRGGFGHTLKRLTCFQPDACDEGCRLGNDCVYGYLFETSPPEDAAVLRNLDEVPRPFVIEPPLERRELFAPGDRLDFHVVLVGRAITYLPYFVLTFQQMGNAGLGRVMENAAGKHRGRFILEEVIALGVGESMPIYSADDEALRSVDLSAGTEVWHGLAEQWPADHLTLEFLTPTRLKHQGQILHTGPSFAALVKVLLGRISSLAAFHGAARWETDFRRWIDRAADVQIARATTQWVDWERYSGRQQQRIAMGGLVGTVTYRGDLAPYRALLALGQLTHVGKGSVFGNGWFTVEEGR